MKTVDYYVGDRGLLIGDRSVMSDRAPIVVSDPATGAAIGSVADGTAADARLAVAEASRAFPGWRARSPRERAEVLRRCYELMTARSESLAQLICAENGKTLADARAEVSYAAEFLRWYSEEAVRAIGEVSLAPSGISRILATYEPIGVCVLVTPWNFPAAMATRKIAPALAAGCTTVLKPATATPLTAYAIADLFREAGVPPGAVNVMTTSDSSAVVGTMLKEPAARLLSFTGSTEVGRHLLGLAADQVLKCAMELGGNAPFLIFDDADLNEAVDGLMVAKMRNGGQACTAANRIYVQRSALPEVAERLTDRMAALRIGPGANETSQCGPLIDHDAVSAVDSLVQDSVRRGARVLTGAGPALQDSGGSFYAPTVLIDVPEASRLVAEEIFGPVAALQAFDTEEEAVARANRTEHGLCAYVYGGDLGRCLRVAGALESGMVAVNRGMVSEPAAPFGGVKHSGLGREGAHIGLLEFMETKYVAVQW